MEENQLLARREEKQLFAQRLGKVMNSQFFRGVGALAIFVVLWGIFTLHWIIVAIALGWFVAVPIGIILTVKYNMYKHKTR